MSDITKLGSSLCVERRDLRVGKGQCLSLSQLMISISCGNLKLLDSSVIDGFTVLPGLLCSGAFKGPKQSFGLLRAYGINMCGRHGPFLGKFTA